MFQGALEGFMDSRESDRGFHGISVLGDLRGIQGDFKVASKSFREHSNTFQEAFRGVYGESGGFDRCH